MAVSWCITASKYPSPPKHYPSIHTPTQFKPPKLPYYTSWKPMKCTQMSNNNKGDLSFENQKVVPKWHNLLSTAASLYPLYVTLGGVVACFNPSAFAWFVSRGPFSYSLSLGFIMLSMGLTLQLSDLLTLFKQRPLSPSLLTVFSFRLDIVWVYRTIHHYAVNRSCAQQTNGASTNVIGGIGLASMLSWRHRFQCVLQVTLIARGDVALSIVMTMCTTLAAVIVTPLLTKYLAGTYVPVDAIQLSISTLQVVVSPILLGFCFQNTVPTAVRVVTPFAPLFAVLTSSLLACSVFSENVVRLRTSGLSLPMTSNTALHDHNICTAVAFCRYVASAICGFQETQRRAVSIEVGMQNSSLGVVLAASHFSSPLVALPAALSAVLMNIMGSSLGVMWRNIDPKDDHKV
ncbi:hypothetical protein RND81_11G068200 [Saponaria officinalis]|uniref:Sodium/metabolite cotransporter BASS1, chloroplastic n=1 Tax=Saponaria officinalis TaxID=3572 RepID=A0AAW1HIV9_SAPOF